jgi:AcrR family transcriptional regulator
MVRPAVKRRQRRRPDKQAPASAAPRLRLGGRSARVRASVLEAAFGVLTEKGFHDFTIAETAARAGVHETSIYRRWKTRQALTMEACLHFAEAAFPPPDTGSLKSDLVALLQRLIAYLSSPQGHSLLWALGVSQDSEAVAARQTYWRRRFTSTRVVFDRAVSRGEFPARIDAMEFFEVLIAPLYLRLLVTGEPLGDWRYEEAIDRLLIAYSARRK